MALRRWGAVRKSELHEKILRTASGRVERSAPLNEVPFGLRLAGLGDLAFYAFTLTSPPGGRPVGEYKIQLIGPGQPRGTRGRLDFPRGAFTVLVGWSPEQEVFALWDAYAHRTFSYSQNLQVKGECVWLARVAGLSTCERRLRGGRGTETMVVCREDRFWDGLNERLRLSAVRLGGARTDS